MRVKRKMSLNEAILKIEKITKPLGANIKNKEFDEAKVKFEEVEKLLENLKKENNSDDDSAKLKRKKIEENDSEDSEDLNDSDDSLEDSKNRISANQVIASRNNLSKAPRKQLATKAVRVPSQFYSKK